MTEGEEFVLLEQRGSGQVGQRRLSLCEPGDVDTNAISDSDSDSDSDPSLDPIAPVSDEQTSGSGDRFAKKLSL